MKGLFLLKNQKNTNFLIQYAITGQGVLHKMHQAI